MCLPIYFYETFQLSDTEMIWSYFPFLHQDRHLFVRATSLFTSAEGTLLQVGHKLWHFLVSPLLLKFSVSVTAASEVKVFGSLLTYCEF